MQRPRRLLTIVCSIAVSGLVAGCPAGQGPSQRSLPGRYAQGTQEAPLPAWLNPLAQIGQSQRLITGNGEDLRQACYYRSSPDTEPEVLVLLRNYQDRSQDRPDKMRILRLQQGTSQAGEFPISADTPPLRILMSPDKQDWAWCAWMQPAGTPVEGGRVLLVSGAQSTDNSPSARTMEPAGAAKHTLGQGLWPLSFTDRGQLACRVVRKMQLYNGLPMPLLDHTAPLQLYDLRQSTGEQTSSVLFLPGPEGQGAGGYQINFDPALPAQASIVFQTGSVPGAKPRQLQRWSLPYFVTYTPHDWEPAMAWADGSSLIALTFQPDAMGPAERPNGGGIFRLLRLDAIDGSASLVEDRVLATTGIVAGDGVVFYSVSPGPNSSGGGWELWASSADGLHKQRLYGAMDTLGLEPIDLLNGRRLLVHHQYFDNAASSPVLRSALLEFSLDSLAGSAPPVVQLDPLPQVQGIEETEETTPESQPEEENSDLFKDSEKSAEKDKYKKGGGFIPDDPGEGGSDSGGGSSGGGWSGGGDPPPIDPD